MGVFSRIRTVVSSWVNALINKAEDPEKMLNQTLLDMQEQLIENKKAVAMAIADEKKLEREMLSQQSQAQDWERKAGLAVDAGKDDLAKEALLRRQEFLNYYNDYNKQWIMQKESVEKLKESLLALQEKIEKANREKNLLIARAKRAQAQQKIQNTMNGMESNSGFDTFDRMSQKVNDMEALADASTELADLSKDNSLDKRFAELEKSDSSADALLAEFKSKKIARPDKSNEA
ncbi:MAG: PspA/IM30 family protein [Spirochaetaceae bacterium]|jgi:phage shock protein A|nr:PspA/IM30 family protein [Spirochaetaceae bacterium]